MTEVAQSEERTTSGVMTAAWSSASRGGRKRVARKLRAMGEERKRIYGCRRKRKSIISWTDLIAETIPGMKWRGIIPLEAVN